MFSCLNSSLRVQRRSLSVWGSREKWLSNSSPCTLDSSAWVGISSLHTSLGQAGWREHVALALQITGLQGEHPWGCALSWCPGLIKLPLVFPVDFFNIPVNRICKAVCPVWSLMGGFVCAARVWALCLFVVGRNTLLSATRKELQKHHLYFEMDDCFIPVVWFKLPFPHSSK